MAMTASAFDTLAAARKRKAEIAAAEKRMLRAGITLAGIIVALVKPLPQAAP